MSDDRPYVDARRDRQYRHRAGRSPLAQHDRRQLRHDGAGPIAAALPTAARLALSGPALPRLADALAIGDRVRMALLRCSDGHPVFAGRDAAGRVVRGPRHDHAWFLPADDDSDGTIDHVLVYARAGLDRSALLSLVQLQRLWGHGSADLTVALVSVGTPDELGCLRRDARAPRTAQLGTARIWESSTPFVPPRHIKYRASGVRDAPHDQVARLLSLHGRPPAQIEPLDARHAGPRQGVAIAWEQFLRRRRRGGGSRGDDRAFGFRLSFEHPVTGPIALGYAAHQGLGQFVAVS